MMPTIKDIYHGDAVISLNATPRFLYGHIAYEDGLAIYNDGKTMDVDRTRQK